MSYCAAKFVVPLLWPSCLAPPHGQYRVALIVTSGRRFYEVAGIRFRFVIGRLQDPEAQTALEAEVHEHQDFMILDVLESYQNTLIKVLC